MKLEIQIPVAELKTALPGLSKVIGKKTTLPVLGCVKAIAEKSGAIKIQATNLDDFATAAIGNNAGGRAGEILVPYEELNKILKGCPDDQIVTVINEGKETILRYPIGSSQVEKRIDFFAADEWPKTPKVESDSIAVSPELKQALLRAFDCASTDDSRYVLQGAYLDTSDKKGHYVVGTNGRVLFSANSFQLGLEKSIIIPNRKFLHWNGFLDDGNCFLSISPVVKDKGGWLEFKSDRWTFLTKQIEGNYPNWKEVMSAEKPNTVLTFSDKAVELVLTAIPKMPGSDLMNEPIRFTIQDSAVILQGRANAVDAWTNLPVMGVTVTGSPITFDVNRTFVAQALKLGMRELELRDNLSPVVFKKDRQKFVVMVLKPDPATTPIQTSPSVQKSPATEPKPETQERSPMAKTAVVTTAPRIETQLGATASTNNGSTNGHVSAFEQLQEQVEKIKTSLKDVVSGLNDVLKTVSQAYKEKRATEKEIESIRESLQEIQRIKI